MEVGVRRFQRQAAKGTDRPTGITTVATKRHKEERKKAQKSSHKRSQSKTSWWLLFLCLFAILFAPFCGYFCKCVAQAARRSSGETGLARKALTCSDSSVVFFWSSALSRMIGKCASCELLLTKRHNS